MKLYHKNSWNFDIIIEKVLIELSIIILVSSINLIEYLKLIAV